MSSLEESIHQVFSSILNAIRDGEKFSFEEEDFYPERGAESQNGQLNLDGSCGLIGSGHPIVIKAALRNSLTGRIVPDKNDRLLKIEKVESFLSETVGKEVELTMPNEEVNPYDGRVPSFLSDDSLKHLNDGSVVTLHHIFPESIGITLKENLKAPFLGLQNEFALNLTFDLCRFLGLGKFYGEHGLIKNRELQLIQSFSGLSIVKNIKGLVVELNTPTVIPNISTLSELLLFPTSLSDVQIQIVKESLEAKCLS